jgi:hypothetical protein
MLQNSGARSRKWLESGGKWGLVVSFDYVEKPVEYIGGCLFFLDLLMCTAVQAAQTITNAVVATDP